MDLMTASPREVDEYAAELCEELGKAEYALCAALDRAHYLLGERPTRSGSGKITGWPTGDDDIIPRLRAINIISRDQRTRVVKVSSTLSMLDNQIDILRSKLETVRVTFVQRGGWSRFFTVDGGHIHSGETCKGGTIRPPTRLGWNPELSGKTEGEAVAKLGPLLCTHCFPSAPIEWTKGHEKKHCDGSGELPQVGSPYRVGMRWYGTCTRCGENQIITNNGFGVIRAHKPPKS